MEPLEHIIYTLSIPVHDLPGVIIKVVNKPCCVAYHTGTFV